MGDEYPGPERRRQSDGWFERHFDDTVTNLRREVADISLKVNATNDTVTELRIEFAARRWSNAIFSAIGGALTVIAGGLLLWFGKGH